MSSCVKRQVNYFLYLQSSFTLSISIRGAEMKNFIPEGFNLYNEMPIQPTKASYLDQISSLLTEIRVYPESKYISLDYDGHSERYYEELQNQVASSGLLYIVKISDRDYEVLAELHIRIPMKGISEDTIFRRPLP